MLRALVAATALILSSMSGQATEPAQTAESVKWKDLDIWSVFMDPSMGNACYVVAAFEGGTVLRVGFDFETDVRQIYVALSNENWKSLEAGKDYPVQIQFDEEAAWTATATGRAGTDATWLYVATTNTNFLDEFSRKLGMRATFRGAELAHLDLKGSSRALAEMLLCQDAVNEAMGATAAKPATPPEDPFAVSPKAKNATDPFDL